MSFAFGLGRFTMRNVFGAVGLRSAIECFSGHTFVLYDYAHVGILGALLGRIASFH